MQFVPKPRLLIQFTVSAITRECAGSVFQFLRAVSLQGEQRELADI